MFLRTSCTPNAPSGWKMLRRVGWILLGLGFLFGPWIALGDAQDQYLGVVGIPRWSVLQPVENGYYNLASGNLHLEIPLGTWSQRAGGQSSASLAYDSSEGWLGLNWSLSTTPSSGSAGWDTDDESDSYCDYPFDDEMTDAWGSGPYVYTEPNGTSHPFSGSWHNTYATNCGTSPSFSESAGGYALDGSGYYAEVSGGGSAQSWSESKTIWAPDGNIVYRGNWSYGNYPVDFVDTNGNVTNGTDTLGRTPVTVSHSGDWTQTYYDVLDSRGSTRRFTASTTNVGSGVRRIDSLTLPDGTSYSFTYESGSLYRITSMTLPTGGTVYYSWGSNSVTHTTGSDSWSYSIATGTNQLTGTLTKPNGDHTVYTFSVNQGNWPTQIDYYNGSVDSSHLLASLSQSYNFSACAFGSCTNVEKTSSTTSLPGAGSTTLKQTTHYCYDSYLNISRIREWKFYTGGDPAYDCSTASGADRTTTIAYLNTQAYTDKHILNRPSAETVTDSSGNTVSQTLYSYDSASPASATGKSNHDDTNYGTGQSVRGNVTEIQRLVGGSTYLSKSMAYDMLGNVVTETDWNGNATTYDYSDNFYADAGNGSNPGSYSPSTSTNGYPTTVTSPSVGGSSLVTHYGYYWGTGQKGLITDPNNETTYAHFYDTLNRPTLTKLPNGGWTYAEYPDATHADTATGITSTSFSISCSGTSGDCRSNETAADSFGRATSQTLTSDPDGNTTVTTQYDANGRVWKTSSPYRSTSDPTYGLDTSSYDGLDRLVQTLHANGNSANTYYGAAVTSSVGGRTSQADSQYGVGYPVLSLDENGKPRQVWYDGFGKVIEADEPASSAASPGSGTTTTSGSEQSVTGNGQPGSGSVTISGSEQNPNGVVGTGYVTFTGSVGGYWYWDDCASYQEYYDDTYGWEYECVGDWEWENDTAWASLTVNGATKSVTYDSGDYINDLANAVNADGSYPVTASVSGATIYLTAKQAGAASNYSLSSSAGGYCCSSLGLSASGSNLTGGLDPDVGYVRITVNGFQATVNYGQSSSASSVAGDLRAAFNNNGSSPVTATGSGATITLTAKTGGVSTDYSVTDTSGTSQSGYSGPSFAASGPSGGTLSGGVNGNTTYDTGTVSVTINGVQSTVDYGQGSTSSAIADALANSINSSNSYVTASLSGLVITLTARSAGSSTNYSISSNSYTNQSGTFSQPSFSLSLSGSALTGGSGGTSLDSSSNATFYKYDVIGNLIEVDQGAQTRTYSYDVLGRLTIAKNPEAGGSSNPTYFYYTASDGTSKCSGEPSNVCRRVRPAPNQSGSTTVTTTYSYDALNRLTGIDYGDSTPDITYSYDQSSYNSLTITNGKGHRTGMSDGSGTTAWSYDEVGNIVTEKRTINSVTKTTTYAYNKDSSLASVTYPSGRTITYATGGAQRPFSAVDSANSINYATNAHYAPQGGLSLLQNGGSLVSTMYYNLSGPCRLSVKNSGSAPSSCAGVSGTTGNVLDFNYGFAANGNVLAINNNRDTTRSQTFTYDALNRLATAAASTYAQSSTNCWGESFSTDRYGNMTSIGAISSAYNGCSQDGFSASVITSTNRISSYCYDTAGNLLGQSDCVTYSYNAENQLVSTGGVTYTYDGDGKRVKSDQTSGSTYDRLYWYDLGLDPLAESDLGGNLTYEYIFFGGTRIARRTVSNNAVNYYVSDHLGSSRVVTDSSGSILDDCDYLPYGKLGPSCSASSGNRYDFAAKERDSESGLDYLMARHYSPWVGRFMQPDEPFADQDASDPQSWNLYSYVRNQVLDFTDPAGRVTNCFPIFVFEPDVSELHYVVRSSCGGNALSAQADNVTKAGQYTGLTADKTAKHDQQRGFVSRIFHSAVCAATEPLVDSAQQNGGAVGIGAGGSFGVGLFLGIAVELGIQAVADPQGNVGIAFTGGGNPGWGVLGYGGVGGAQFMNSDAKSIYDLRGGAFNAGGSISIGGVGVNVEGSRGDSAKSATATVGAGVGTKGAAYTLTYTFVPSKLSTSCRE